MERKLNKGIVIGYGFELVMFMVTSFSFWR